MKILFTGASSFTGMWFVQELVQSGHEVTMIFRRSKEDYQGIRRQRIERLLPIASPVFCMAFGDESFIRLAGSRGWDLFCHHAADVTDYKSPQFDFAAALANNTRNISRVLQTLKREGCLKVLLSGSVFEQFEGAGSDQLRAVSPYGLSKTLTAQTFAFYASQNQMKLGTFVIPNPFGPFEENRFTSYLAKTWLNQETASVKTPKYIRDNVPVSLLAKIYAQFADRLSPFHGCEKINPSFYIESQEMFARRFSAQMQELFKVPCMLKMQQQEDFSEPLVRINTDPIDSSQFQWSEQSFWDESARYYLSVQGKK